MNKGMRIGIVWIVAIIVVAISYYVFVLPYANVENPGFLIWSLGKPLAFGAFIVAIEDTKSISSNNKPR